MFTLARPAFTTAVTATLAGSNESREHAANRHHRGTAKPLYSPEERRRRDASRWTIVQGVLAPLQFLVCIVSLCCIFHYLLTGQGLWLATTSVVIKTAALYAIMVTGSIWEREVFGRYLFAPAFFWEDAVSMVVLALHTAYLAALATGALGPRALLCLALAGYATYIINAAQFVLKLRAARLGSQATNLAEAVR